MTILNEAEQAYLELKANPEDDRLRLIYADMLEDLGQPKRAQLQREMARKRLSLPIGFLTLQVLRQAAHKFRPEAMNTNVGPVLLFEAPGGKLVHVPGWTPYAIWQRVSPGKFRVPIWAEADLMILADSARRVYDDNLTAPSARGGVKRFTTSVERMQARVGMFGP